jgi:hypothetical protein
MQCVQVLIHAILYFDDRKSQFCVARFILYKIPSYSFCKSLHPGGGGLWILSCKYIVGYWLTAAVNDQKSFIKLCKTAALFSSLL